MQLEFNNPFEEDGNWYKGNLHTHTTGSDGALSPEDTAQQYKKAGYHFLSITDHNCITRIEKNQGILLIPGEEMACGRKGSHIVGIGLKEAITYNNDQITNFGKNFWEVSPREMAELIKKQGGVSIIAHPHWSGLDSCDMLEASDCDMMEVFNTNCHHEQDKAYCMTYWDNLLMEDKNIFAVASDDAHNRPFAFNQPDACGSWIMVKAKKLTEWDIMQQIKRGMFYASWGPEIKDLKISGNTIHVTTSLVKSISFISCAGVGAKFTADKEPIKEAEYVITGPQQFVRVQCCDMQGRMAWTNAVIIK